MRNNGRHWIRHPQRWSIKCGKAASSFIIDPVYDAWRQDGFKKRTAEIQWSGPVPAYVAIMALKGEGHLVIPIMDLFGWGSSYVVALWTTCTGGRSCAHP